MLCRASSHICGRWYLPMFLFRDELLTLMYRACFNCSQEVLILSSHYTKVVNSDTVTRDDRMVIDGEGVLRCSLNLSAKFLADSPMYSSSHSTLLHLDLYMTPLFFIDGIFIFWGHKEVFDGKPSFLVNLHPMSATCSFKVLTQALMVWNNNVWVD